MNENEFIRFNHVYRYNLYFNLNIRLCLILLYLNLCIYLECLYKYYLIITLKLVVYYNVYDFVTNCLIIELLFVYVIKVNFMARGNEMERVVGFWGKFHNRNNVRQIVLSIFIKKREIESVKERNIMSGYNF